MAPNVKYTYCKIQKGPLLSISGQKISRCTVRCLFCSSQYAEAKCYPKNLFNQPFYATLNQFFGSCSCHLMQWIKVVLSPTSLLAPPFPLALIQLALMPLSTLCILALLCLCPCPIYFYRVLNWKNGFSNRATFVHIRFKNVRIISVPWHFDVQFLFVSAFNFRCCVKTTANLLGFL